MTLNCQVIWTLVLQPTQTQEPDTMLKLVVTQDMLNYKLQIVTMCINLSTARTNGGWMYFKFNNDDYIQLSSSNHKINIYKETLASSTLKVGVSAATSNIKTSATNDGNTSYCELKAVNKDHGNLRLNTNYDHGTLYVGTNSNNFFRLDSWNNQINFYKPTTGTSDDRLKENGELIENACDTLSKLRPQIYNKKPSINNTDSTKWYKENGLIAHEVYYDCPKSKHLVHRESNSESPDIPTPIGPKSDPDYSSWGEEPASSNHIGLIAYLVKADTKLHERVKALEG